jgi:hypothetical protein
MAIRLVGNSSVSGFKAFERRWVKSGSAAPPDPRRNGKQAGYGAMALHRYHLVSVKNTNTASSGAGARKLNQEHA